MEKKVKPYKILAVETSGRTCSLAIAEGGPVPILRGEVFFDIGLRHSDILMECCDFLMGTAAWKKEDLTHLAVSTGPGSFTGIRVGIAFTRALAQSMKIPLIGLSTFDILARRTRAAGIEGPLCIAFESIGDEVFAGLYGADGTSPTAPYAVHAVPDLIAKLRSSKSVLGLGDGFDKHREPLQRALGRKLRIAPADLSQPRAGTLALLAGESLRSARSRIPSWDKIVPFYMRPPLVVERLKKGKKS